MAHIDEPNGKYGQFEITDQKASLKAIISVIGAVLNRNVRMWIRFRVSFFTDLMSTMVSASIFLLVSRLVEAKVTSMNYTMYVAIGVMMMKLFESTLAAPYQSIADAYWMCRLEPMLLSPTPIWVPMLGDVVWQHARLIVDLFFLSLLCGFFGALPKWPDSPGLLLLTLFIGMAGILGMGLISAASFSLINAKGWSDPFRWLVSTFAGLMAGAYFPISLLPDTLGRISILLPHTLILDISRSVLSGIPQQYVMRWGFRDSILRLSIISVAWIICGVALFSLSIKKSRDLGRLSRWV